MQQNVSLKEDLPPIERGLHLLENKVIPTPPDIPYHAGHNFHEARAVKEVLRSDETRGNW